MHPVLIYSVIFIATTIGLLFVFEAYPVGSIYLLLLISSFVTAIVGKVLIKAFSEEDPMREETEKEKDRQRARNYQREMQFIFNLVQPDPKFQPSTKRLNESLKDCFNLDEKIMQTRLKQYFGESFDIVLDQPLPDLVVQIKKEYKTWSN